MDYLFAPSQKNVSNSESSFEIHWQKPMLEYCHAKLIITAIALMRFTGQVDGLLSVSEDNESRLLSLSLEDNPSWESLINPRFIPASTLEGEIIASDTPFKGYFGSCSLYIYTASPQRWEVFTKASLQSSLLCKMIDNLTTSFLTNRAGNLSNSCHLDDSIRNEMLFQGCLYTSPTQEETWIDRFVAHAINKPNDVALVIGNKEFTYDSLYLRASSIAYYLKSKGIKKGDAVGVLLDRGVHWATCVLGVMLGGFVYVPFDKSHPLSRRKVMLSQAEVSYLLTDDGDTGVSDVEPLNVHSIQTGNIKFAPEVEPKDAAYMLFTSGTTGIPKGAIVQHAGMLNHILGKVSDLELTEFDVIAQNAGQCFDISIWQLVCSWCVGAKTVLYPQSLILDTDRLIKYTLSTGVTLLEVVPSYLEVILDAEKEKKEKRLGSLRYLMVTGERVTPGQFNRWLEVYPKIPVVNAYGPTEASDDITHFISSTVQSENVPLGYALPHCRIYILDNGLQPLPRGVVGEICIAGIAVGLGYKNRKEETDKSFVLDVYSPDVYSKMYRTGDLGWMDESGLLHMVGRLDEQVKVNGNRVELSDIEHAMSMCANVEMVAAIVCNGRLIGFYTGSAVAADIKEKLLNILPSAVVPSKIVNLAEMPLSHNGKIDKKHLKTEAERDLQ